MNIPHLPAMPPFATRPAPPRALHRAFHSRIGHTPW